MHRAGRREFLRTSTIALGLGGLAWHLEVPVAAAAEDAPNTHNMLLVGEQAAFLSHLPMFNRLNGGKTAFASPHRYQVILEATLQAAGKDVTERYLADRKAHPEARIYTVGPEDFVLTRLFTPAATPALGSFTATVFRGHLENGGQPVDGLDRARVKVTRVVHGRQLSPRDQKPDELEYIAFGKGSELFLAHAIFGPPDFDQTLSARLVDRTLTEEELKGDLRLTLPGRRNGAAQRLREGSEVPAVLKTAAGTSEVKVQAVRQLYFEEGELLVPPTFDPTSEEKADGPA
jgi:hypothetical protein